MLCPDWDWGLDKGLTVQTLTAGRYCIQPPGDGPTRHATMDCFAAGSQPLFFDQHITAVRPTCRCLVASCCCRDEWTVQRAQLWRKNLVDCGMSALANTSLMSCTRPAMQWSVRLQNLYKTQRLLCR